MRTYKHPNLETIDLVDILHALGDHVRLAIVQELVNTKAPLNCSALGQLIGPNCAPSTCNHHLRILREAGLIRSERKGLSVENTLRQEEIEQKFPGLLSSFIKYSKIA